MIKTPLSTVLGGAFWTPGCTVIGGNTPTLDQQIQKLFANGEQGFFYDPSDLSTMYQDAAGIIPVTAAGQPVGLLLDKSKGLVLGLNIATVTSVVGAGIGGGAYKHTLITDQLVIGKRYAVRVKVTNYSGTGEVGIDFSTFKSIPQNISKDGVITLNGVAESAAFRVYTKSTNNADFSEITIQELHGNHAYQTTSAARPILQDVPRRIDFDAVDDKLTTTLAAQLTGCTMVKSIPNVGTQILTGQTIPATYEDNTDHCGLIVINRALTPSETSAIAAEFNKRAGV